MVMASRGRVAADARSMAPEPPVSPSLRNRWGHSGEQFVGSRPLAGSPTSGFGAVALDGSGSPSVEDLAGVASAMSEVGSLKEELAQQMVS